MVAPKRSEFLIIAALFAIFFELVGYISGQDANWDQLNYHLSSTASWLLEKPWSDYAISQQQSWFNPLPGVPGYLIVTQLPNRTATVVLALLPIANALAVFLIARRFVFAGRDWLSFMAAAGCAFVGATGTVHLTVVASTSVESWISAPVLIGMYWLMKAAADGTELRHRDLVFAGICLGAAAGLKATNLVYCLGGAASALVAITCSGKRASAAVTFAAAGLLAFAVAGGWWHWQLWSEFGDPVFPMGSGPFASSWIGPDALPPEPHEFKRSHWWQLFTDPFLLAIGDHRTPLSTLMPVRDSRYLVGFYGSLALLTGLAWRQMNGQLAPQARAHAAMAVFFLASYVVWVVAFNIDRYAIPLELVSAVLAGALIVDIAGADNRSAKLACLAVLGVMLLTTKPVRTHRAPVTENWYDASVPKELARNDTLYVMTGMEAMGWLTVYDKGLGDRPSFVRIAGNLRIDPAKPLGKRIIRAIATHRGPIRSLTSETEMAAAPEELARFGLTIAPGRCAPIRNKVLPDIMSCPLAQVRASAL